MNIQILNPIFSKVTTAEDAQILASFLKYKSSYYKQTQFRKIEKAYVKPLVKKGIFLTGFIPMIQGYCKSRNIPIQVSHQDLRPGAWSKNWAENYFPIEFHNATDALLSEMPIPGGLRLKEDQVEAIEKMVKQGRGVVWHPTGSGKTIIFLSFISLFPKSIVLIIVNSQDLLFQISDKASEFFPGEVGIIGAGVDNPKRITVATIQSLVRSIDPEQEWFASIDIVVVDEAHHLSKFALPFESGAGGTYARVLSVCTAPIRMGFTATLPYLEEAKMALEGYIGPVISMKKISEVKRLAKIKVVLKKLPITLSAREARTYQDVYKYAVTYNSRRHKMVLETASELVEAGRTVLILVTLVQHGENVLSMAKRSFPHLRVDYVHGQVSGNIRGQIKKKLNSGELDVVIADAVWKEGVDIPTLGAIINASGGKSEIMTIQAIGRGLRTVPGIKEDVVLVDFFDESHRYLRDHFSERLCLYFREGWM
jgi:superfamily II DNA or RNA helicase